MLPFNSVNIIAVIVSTIACMAVGMFWYSTKGFGNAWMQATGITMEQAQQIDMKAAMAKGFINTFVGTYVIALIVALVQPGTPTDGITLAVLLMLAIPVPMQISGLIWEHRSKKLMNINVGYSLVTTAVTIAILMNWPA